MSLADWYTWIDSTNHRATQHGQQVIEIYRFGEHGKRPQLIAATFGDAHAREDQRRDRAPRRMLTTFRQEIPPVHHRHIEIHDERVDGLAGSQVIERLGAIARIRHSIPFLFEQHDEGIAKIRMIVDDENRRAPNRHDPVRIHEGDACQLRGPQLVRHDLCDVLRITRLTENNERVS